MRKNGIICKNASFGILYKLWNYGIKLYYMGILRFFLVGARTL